MDDMLEDVIAGALRRHRHWFRRDCPACVAEVARAVRASTPAPWPPPRQRIP